jgi:hypothetical protein
MIELLVRKSVGCLVPADPLGMDTLATVADGAELTVRATYPRNPGHHRKFFALLNEVFHNQNHFATLESMLDAIKVALGYCEQFTGMRGETITVPKSISFASMGQDAFQSFYDRAVNLIIEKVLPGTKSEDLENRIYQILGEPTPSDLR